MTGYSFGKPTFSILLPAHLPREAGFCPLLGAGGVPEMRRVIVPIWPSVLWPSPHTATCGVPMATELVPSRLSPYEQRVLRNLLEAYAELKLEHNADDVGGQTP